jgi:heat shock protein HslJ
MKKLPLALAAGAALAMFGLTACAGGSSSDPAAAVVGVWGERDTRGEPSLEFMEDGSYAGSDGCNNLMGSWTVEGDTIDLGVMASTMMACEGVDTWLVQGATAVVNGDTLEVKDEGGRQIGTLDRQRG